MTTVNAPPSFAVERAPPPLGSLVWLNMAALVAHVLEELPRFPAWATTHFGTTSTRFFVLSHIPLLAAVAWIAQRAAKPAPHPLAVWLAVGVQAALATNAMFHVATTIWFHEYSPGLFSAVLLYLPLTVFVLTRGARFLGRARAATACLVGGAVSVLLAASLWVDVRVL